MSRYRRIADEVRAFLQGEDQRLTDGISAAAVEFAAGCAEANERLRRCMDLIRQGLRAEAVHEADAEPPVAELVTELDLAELQSAWDEVCSLYDLPRAEPLRLEFAEAVHEAYAELEPLNALLSRHRRLALARAPLPSRIGVLRQLVAADPLTGFWEDDLRAYERARLREVEPAARNAARSGDTATLRAIVEELDAPDWRETPTAELKKKVRAWGGQVVRQTATADLEAILPDLEAAFAALDLPAARTARDRWADAARRAKLGDDDPLAERAGPALGWVADEDAREETERAFRQSVSELERAVDNDAIDPVELERRAHAAARFDRELPAPLVTAYRNRRSALETAGRRKRTATFAAAAAGLLLVLGSGGLLVWRAGQSHRVKQYAGEVTGLVREDKLPEARRLFDEHKGFSANDIWLTARRTLEEAEGKEAGRKSGFAAAVERANAADSAKAATAPLKEARDLAKRPEEKLEVARLERTWQDRKNATFEKNESQFRTAAEAAAGLLQQADAGVASASLPALEGMVREAEAAVEGLGRLAAGVRPEVAGEREVLAARLAATRTAVADRRDRETSLAAMTAALKSGGDSVAGIDRYVAAAEAYRKRFPNDPRSAEFGESLAEADLWRGAAAWRNLTNGWRDVRPPTAAAAAQRLAALDGFLAGHPGSASSAVGKRYAALLRSFAARAGEEGATAQLLELFREPLIGGPLDVLRTRDGRAYYLPSPADFTQTVAANFAYVSGSDVRRDLRTKLIPKDQLVSLRSSAAPQVAVAEAVRRDLPRTTPATWDGYLLDLSKRLLAANGFDPFVQHQLLTRTLERAGEGNSLLAGALTEVRSRLEDEDIDPAARWMDPEDIEANRSRARAEAALRRIAAADLDAAWAAAREAEAALAGDLGASHRPAGWACRDGSAWGCRGGTSAGPATLAAILPGGADEPAAWQDVGRIGPSGADLRGGGLKQGRLLFLADTPESAKTARSGE